MTTDPRLWKLFGLTLWEPWATLIAQGDKALETRGWQPPWYLLQSDARLVIHAGRRWQSQQARLCEQEPFRQVLTSWPFDEATGALPAGWLPPRLGDAVAICRLGGVIATQLDRDRVIVEAAKRDADPGPFELEFGDFRGGRYAWCLADVCPLTTPVALVGQQTTFPIVGPPREAILDQVVATV